MKNSSICRPIKGSFAASFVLKLLVLAATAGVAWAQESASISGTVTDTTGAVVPHATVKVKNVETGATRTLFTDGVGIYRALSLAVGRYEVKFEKTGFKAVIQKGINLVVGQQAVVNMALDVGAVSEQVTVTTEPSLVNVTPVSTAGLVGEQQVKDLPLNGRSFDNLITLNPSTANTSSYRSTTSTGAGQGNNFSVGGGREDYNIFLLNGVEYTGLSTADVIPGGTSGQLLGVDAVREFNVQQNAYGAEYGKRSGGQVRIVTMSGSNDFHGTLFEFIRNNVLDARNFFDQGPTPPFKRNQFGGSAGGPLKKDKTFIFGNYEGFRQRLALSSVAVVPDDNARNGFLPNSSGVLQNIGLAPGIKPYFALWPEPNGPELLVNNVPTGAALAFSHPGQKIREDFGNIRLDHNLGNDDTLSGAYTIDDGDNLTPGANPLQQTLTLLRAHVFSLQHTHTFSSSTLNNALIGFSRAKLHLNSAMAVNDPSLVFVPGAAVGQISIGASGLGTLGSFASAGASGGQQFEIMARNLFTYADDVQMSRGRHLIRLGAWFQRVQSNDDAADQRNGVASFTDLQSFMLGKARQVVATLNPLEIPWRQWEGAWFVEDSIKLHPKFTLSLGLRQEFNNGWNSPTGQASNFVFGPNGILLTQPVIGESVYANNNAKLLFGPRVGIAWAPFSKTAIHVGFGTYYNQLDYMGSCCDAAPLLPFNDKVSITGATFPLAVTSSAPGAKTAPSGVDPNLKTPTVEQYTLRIEQGIRANTVVSIGYVGSHGYHLLNTVDVNTAIPTILPDGSQQFVFTGTVTKPIAPPRANPNLSNTRYTLSNANSNYNGAQVDVLHRFSHGLQFRGNYTFSKSLDIHSSSFLANEGIGGSTTVMDPRNLRVDYGPSNFDITHRFTGNFSYQLPIGRGQPFLGGVTGVVDKLVSGWQWNGIAIIQSGFPFTPLVGFNASGNGDSRAPDRVSLNPNFSGDPIIGTPGQWFTPGAFLVPCTPGVTVNTLPNCPALRGTYGNAGRDILRGPGLGSFDTSVFKTTKITERLNLQFRAEAFNVLNRTNLGMPVISTFTSSGAVSPSAGLITYTATSSRQLQFGLKLGW
jgi:hypothetical protein